VRLVHWLRADAEALSVYYLCSVASGDAAQESLFMRDGRWHFLEGFGDRTSVSYLCVTIATTVIRNAPGFVRQVDVLHASHLVDGGMTGSCSQSSDSSDDLDDDDWCAMRRREGGSRGMVGPRYVPDQLRPPLS
jgi:hypothetical protein